MDSPFTFIKEVVGTDFVGRAEELVWISSNMLNAQDTVLIASSRYGKTSLIRQALISAQTQEPGLKVCYINLFNVRQEHEFYSKIVNEGIRAFAETMEDWISITRKYFPLTNPEIEISDTENEISLSFDKQNLADSSADECINFFQKYAEDYNAKITVCIEEFQNIDLFENTVKFQKKLAKALKQHDKVAYVLSGGKKNSMKELFEKPKTPFYQFGDIFTFQPIEKKIFADYISKTFSKSGRVIKPEQAENLCDAVNSHPYYVQLLSHLTWISTKGFVTDQTEITAKRDLLDYCHKEFVGIVNLLSTSQINYLRAVIDDVDRFCSSEMLEKYELNSSANVARIRTALTKKEVLEFHRGKPSFLDPVFKKWFEKIYMAK